MVTNNVPGNWISTDLQYWVYHPGVIVLLVRFYTISPLSYRFIAVTDFGSDFVYKLYIKIANVT